jgi:lipopolysaccharide export LptBFGC system permease protein LptF
MALASELDACWAAGISPMRLMRVPMLAALLLSLAHVGLRGFVEPRSEQRLDRMGQQARTGDFGLSLRAGELRHLSATSLSSPTKWNRIAADWAKSSFKPPAQR